jgi:HEAT repeat protein
MEPLFGLIAVAIAASIGYLVAAERRRAHLRAWREAAARVGLTDVEEYEGGLFGGASVRGRSGEVKVQLEEYRRGKYEHGTKIVAGLGHGAGGLSLRREGLGTAIEKRVLGEREIEIGDSSFDEEFYVQGRAPLAFALLDPETRRRLTALLRNRIALPTGGWVDVSASLSEGVLEVRVKESGVSGNRERVPDILAVVLEVGRRLVAPRDVAARIAENLRTESAAGTRVELVKVLAREFPRHPATRDALLAACQDPSEEVRLRAGIALGEDGRQTLLDLVSGAGVVDSCAARAVEALRSRLPAEKAEEALARALGGAGRPLTAKACLETLAQLRRTEAEGLMLEALRSSDATVSLAAARALGKAGSIAAVPALREAAEAGREMRGTARQAVAEIQARLTGAEPGQLSLAGAEAGALSLADSAGAPGRLTLVEEAAPIADEEEGDSEATGERKPKREGQITK